MARPGGDEFAILLPGLGQVRRVIEAAGPRMAIGTGIGGALHPEGVRDPDAPSRRGDA